MLNLLNQTAAPTWDDPIEMLYACHGKVKKFCGQLHLLPDYIAQHGCNAAAQEAITQISTYFNRAAPLHHEDEELDFFPLLSKYCPEAQIVIDELEAQHIDLHKNWDALHTQLQETLAGVRVAPDMQIIQNFTMAYDEHIPKEETLFELGKTHIPPSELGEIGKIMAARRVG